ncbi:uncharacterized protein F5Z01DRAFT_665335 [Emericellopsis atlantica]|uniref:RBR-type E3 ubiquitin transferase n=1 Tax=Emericellopsis atlantica TaxID=2614577 RepID=A0A9P7ZEP2_9HYPO|nr:uncharacterized protein F5Z01DRAFT_665335 [Emericellopsis atlantica]KAG9250615.1 hypothetical protein F5Z01DRAFT_665335 [Emericellopsis atlantica]
MHIVQEKTCQLSTVQEKSCQDSTMAYPIDNASLDLITKLQLEDAESLLKGKHAVGHLPDAELAVQMFKEELEQLQTFIADDIMCRSIAEAMLSDTEAIQRSLDEEQQAIYDREYATNIDSMNPDSVNIDPMNVSPHTFSSAPLIDDEMMGKLAIMFIDAGKLPGRAPHAVHAESSSQGAKAAAKYGTRHCTGCEEDVSYIDTVRCPSSHDYCRTCIAGLFEAAINDESLFPARCCRQAIPLGLNQIFIPPKLAGRYRAKEVEHGTPNRTYCHNLSCSTFVPPQFIRGRRATCVKCHSRTCTDCKKPAHEGDCPPDATTLDALRLANKRGWQRCLSCRNLIELSTGCNHISCRCGAQFCYVCGEKWKTCNCEQWHENRLLDRASTVVDRDVGHELDEAERAARMEQEQQNLRDNQECGHESWSIRPGAFQCEECQDHLPQYIFECAGCRILACRTCRHNRL